MTMDFAASARALVGTRFRLQGRGPEGLDCIGLALAVYGLPAGVARRDYGLRNHDRGEIQHGLGPHFRKVAQTQLRAGDLVLVRVAADQFHLCVRTAAGFVHAHSRLRRVVETPGLPDWPIVGVYRRRTR